MDFDVGKDMSLASSTYIGFKKTEKRRNIYLMLTLPRNPINIQKYQIYFDTITFLIIKYNTLDKIVVC